MTAEDIRYHFPGIGSVFTPLHNESAALYRFLDSAGEVDRLRALDHLGIVRAAWEGAHHPRWEYVVLTAYVVEKCRVGEAVHLAHGLKTFGAVISSGSELLKSWSLLLNIGHLDWTFTAERALLLELRESGNARKKLADLLGGDADLQQWANHVIDNALVHQFFQVLSFARLQQLSGRTAIPLDPKWTAMLKAYVLDKKSERVARLHAAYRNIRRLAYLALDTHYTPSLVTVDLAQVLSDDESLENVILHDVWGEIDELAGLQDHLDRDIYLAAGVLKQIAARERSLRELVRASLRHSGVQRTIEKLAQGELQRAVRVESVTPVTRLRFWLQPELGFFVDPPNVAVEQDWSEEVGRRLSNDVRVVVWAHAAGRNWILQTHTMTNATRSRAAAYIVGFSQTVRHHHNTVTKWQRLDEFEQVAQRLLYGTLASDLIVSALALFLDEGVSWEWVPRRGHMRAVLMTRDKARDFLASEAGEEDLPPAARDELTALSQVLPGRRNHYLAVSTTNLIAYARDEEGRVEQLAELDGVAVSCSPKSVTLVIA